MNMSIPIPGLIESKVNGNEAELTFGPYAPGFAITIGTCMRRCLLSSIPSPGITSILIQGISHKFEVVPGMKEELLSFIENLKQVNFKFMLPGLDRTSVKLEVSEPMVVTSSMIECNQDAVRVLNDVYLCTIHPQDLKDKFKCEIFLKEGQGYVDNTSNNGDIPMNAIRINNSLNAVKRVALHVEQVRYGDRTDYELLKMQMKTVGITAKEALYKAAKIINDHLNVFTKQAIVQAGSDAPVNVNKNLTRSIKDIGLSERTVEALQKAPEGGIQTIGDLARCTESYLKSLPRLGTTKVQNIKVALAMFDLSLKDGSIVKEDSK